MIYLDNSATSRFKPIELANIITESAFNSCNAGRSGHNDAIRLGKRIFSARESLKHFTRASDEYEVIFTSNCSEALNLAIFGYLDAYKNDKCHVITTMNEHNSVLRPLRQLELQGRITTSYLTPNKDGVVTSSDLDGAICEDTRLVIINHTSNVTGATCDMYELGKVCKARGVALLVDGAQSLGHTPVDVVAMNITMLAGAAHKGLHGIQGVGFLVMRKDTTIRPLKFGGTGTSSDSVDQPTMLPESLECGTLNSLGVLALECGARFTERNFDAIHKLYHYLSSEFFYGARHISGITLYSQYPSDVMTFNIKDYSSSEVADALNTQNIAVRSGLHCAPFIHQHLGTLERGAVRASIGYNNSIHDIKALLIAIENIARM